MYDFETILNRKNSGSYKWNQMFQLNQNVHDSTIPFSVADMEFKTPPEIVEGLKKYLDTNVLGYTIPTKKYLDTVCNWMKKRHNWDIDPEWIVESPGVVVAFFSAIKALSKPGDGVIIMTPVYYPFYSAIERNDRILVKNSLIEKDLKYFIDFDDLEKKARDPRNKILLFCSPHNPVSRVWTLDELERVGKICLENNVLIISDEIHFDIIMPGFKHTIFATVSERLANNIVVCTAPSKTFNLAGMQTSNIIIPNQKIRDKFIEELESNGMHLLNALGYKTCEIAYSECESWLDELIKIVYDNHLLLKEFINNNIPGIKVFDLEGTYLQWLDFNELGLDKYELEKLLNKFELFFDEGYMFGDEASGFERINLACPTNALISALNRLKKVVENLKI